MTLIQFLNYYLFDSINLKLAFVFNRNHPEIIQTLKKHIK